jgi:hypothetical protein
MERFVRCWVEIELPTTLAPLTPTLSPPRGEEEGQRMPQNKMARLVMSEQLAK